MSDPQPLASSSSGSARWATSSTRIPAAAALRARFPSARIDWMVDPRYVELLQLVDGLDHAHSGRSAAPASSPRCSRRCASCGARDYDAAIDLQGLLKSAVLARAGRRASACSGSRRRICASRWRALFYTDTPDPCARRTSSTRTSRCWRRSASRPARRAFPLERAAHAGGRGSVASRVRRRRRTR